MLRELSNQEQEMQTFKLKNTVVTPGNIKKVSNDNSINYRNHR